MSEEVPITWDEKWFIGEDKILRFTVRDESGEIEDLLGWDLEWVLKEFVADTSPEITKTTTLGITVTDPATGIVDVDIDAADTIDLAEGEYHHELWRTNTGSEQKLAFGTVTLRR